MTRFTQALKNWRMTRHFSQMDLALEADVSARHIAFPETGRAQPSREMIGRPGDALTLPLSGRNQTLTADGFAPRYAQRAWNADEMAPVRAAPGHMPDAHAPHPAFALDRLWSVVQMNAPAQALFGPIGVSVGRSFLCWTRSQRSLCRSL